MATLIKTASGTWKAVIRKTGWPMETKTFRTKRDADDWSRRTEDEMVRGVFIQRGAAERTIFAEALERYVKEVTPIKKLTTQKAERLRVKPLTDFFGQYAMTAISADLVARYRDQRLSTPSQRKDLATGEWLPLKPATVRLELALLGHVFTTAIKEWRIGLVANPVHNIRKPSSGAGRDRRLHGDEEARLHEALAKHSNPMIAWIVRIALETGMRSSEITGLRLRQVELSRRIVRLSDTKNDSSRTVPMTREALAVFELAMANPTRPKDTDLVFFGEPGKDGKRRPYNFNKVWNNLKNGLGLSDLRFHDLRHEAVSRLVEKGLGDQEVSAISGHKSMQMLKRYTHLRAEDLVKRLDEVTK
jgi:integrase